MNVILECDKWDLIGYLEINSSPSQEQKKLLNLTFMILKFFKQKTEEGVSNRMKLLIKGKIRIWR